MSILSKWPRHYAADIIALPTKEQRVAALNQVPEQWRDWVRAYVKDHFAKRHFLKVHHANTIASAPSHHRFR
ncbi:MAG: hypothetical protein WAW36_19080 [Methylovulum miyakonense]